MNQTSQVLAQRHTSSPPAAADQLWPNLQKLAGTLDKVLPRHVGIDRFTRLAFTELRRNPRLAECDWQSIAGSLMVCAELGLEPGGPLGHAWLIPYRGQATVQIGYKGYIDLARRSGQILSLSGHAVHTGDRFTYRYGLDEALDHEPALHDRGDAYAYYAVARYQDGGHNIVVLSREDVERYRRRSASAQQGRSSPWDTDYDAMAVKTCIRRLVPYLPLATEQLEALSADEGTARIDDTGVLTVSHTTAPEMPAVAVPEPAAAVTTGDSVDGGGGPVDVSDAEVVPDDKPRRGRKKPPPPEPEPAPDPESELLPDPADGNDPWTGQDDTTS